MKDSLFVWIWHCFSIVINVMSPKLRNFLLIVNFTLVSFSAMGQVGPPPPPPPPVGLVVPIDQNIIALLIFGFFLGLYSLLRSNKKDPNVS